MTNLVYRLINIEQFFAVYPTEINCNCAQLGFGVVKFDQKCKPYVVMPTECRWLLLL